MVNVEKGTRRKVCICFQHDFLLAVCPNLQLSLGGGFPRGYSRNFYYFLATNVFYLFLVLAFEVLQLSEENILSTKVTRLHSWLRAIQSSCKSVCKLLTFYFYFYFFMAIIENRCWSRHSERENKHAKRNLTTLFSFYYWLAHNICNSYRVYSKMSHDYKSIICNWEKPESFLSNVWLSARHIGGSR